MRTMREISELTSFKALNSLSNLPFENLAKNFVFDERLFSAFDAGHLGADLFEMDAEIAKEIAEVADFNLLSDSAKQKLSSIYHIYLLPLLISYVVAVCTGSNPDIVESLSKLFATHEQVEFIGTPSENNSPDNRRNEQSVDNAIEIAEQDEYEEVNLKQNQQITPEENTAVTQPSFSKRWQGKFKLNEAKDDDRMDYLKAHYQL
jgi:hypothetical protein